jgi:hypothetical protein
MLAGDDGQPGCPVCGLGPGPGPDCAECGWTLRTVARAGPVTALIRQEFDARLSQARRTVDTGIAALLSADPNRYQALIRGGRPDAAEWAAARQAATRAGSGAVGGEQLRAVLWDLLSGLQAGDDTVVAEIDPDGITVARAALDRFGSPLMERVQDTAGWAELLPMLASDPEHRLFQLAGGISKLDRDRLWAAVRAAVSAAAASRLLVICRPVGWLILERAAELMAQQVASSQIIRAGVGMSGWAAADESVLGGPASDGLVGRLVSELPLRCEYGLLVAVVDPLTRAVRTEVQSLFAPGDLPGREASLLARRLPGDHGEVTLATMAGQGSARELLAVATGAPPAGASYRIRAVLDGPGRIRFVEPAGGASAPQPWSDVLAALPTHVNVALGPFDLVCAVELAGAPETIRLRRDLLRDLLELLEAEFPAADMLRVGMLGCTDHVFEPGRERRRVVKGAPLGPIGDARGAMTRLSGVAISYPKAAPLEDLLYEAAGQLRGSRGQGRTASFLLLAGRPPHPYHQGHADLHPCPLRHDWRSALRTLTSTCAASCVAVTDALPRSHEQAQIWRELGRTRLRQLDATNARQIGEDLQILPARSQRIPIPLVSPERGK